MNLGQAVALCLYELARDPKAALAAPGEDPPRHRGGDRSRSPRMLLEALERSGYVNPMTAASDGREGAAAGEAAGYRGPGRSGAAGDAAADFVEGGGTVEPTAAGSAR